MYKNKYLKYKNKYLKLKNQIGGLPKDDDTIVVGNLVQIESLNNNIGDRFDGKIGIVTDIQKYEEDEFYRYIIQGDDINGEYSIAWGYHVKKIIEFIPPEINEVSKTFLDDWTIIENFGQHNCGLFISEKFKDKILLCRDGISKIDEYIDVMKKYKIMPILYSINHIGDNYYFMSEKLDGDITSIFYNTIPERISNLSEFVQHKDILLKLFKFKKNVDGVYLIRDSLFNYFLTNPDKLTEYEQKYNEHLQLYPNKSYWEIPAFMFDHLTINIAQDEPATSVANYRSKIKLINDIKLLYDTDPITFQLFDNFSKMVKNSICGLLPNIIKEITKIRYNLIKIGYDYDDTKFDNYGYKLENSKYNYFIIDFESGLRKIFNDEPNTDQYILNRIANEFNNKFNNYGVNDGNKLYRYYLFPIIHNFVDSEFNPFDLPIELKKILESHDTIDKDAVIFEKIEGVIVDSNGRDNFRITSSCLDSLKRSIDI